MVTRNDSLWKSLDWVTICIYLLLIVGGWFSVCGASYDYGDRDFLDFSTRAGKQFVWIICSFGLGFVLLMLEDRMYDMFAYIIYIGMIILLIVTIFIAPDTKGSRSWLVMGPVSLPWSILFSSWCFTGRECRVWYFFRGYVRSSILW